MYETHSHIHTYIHAAMCAFTREEQQTHTHTHKGVFILAASLPGMERAMDKSAPVLSTMDDRPYSTR